MKSRYVYMLRRSLLTLLGALILSGCQTTPAMSPLNTEEGFFGKLKSSTTKVARSFGRSKTSRHQPSKGPSLEFPSTELTQENFSSVQFAMGRSHEEEGNLRAAKASYEAAIRNSPKSSLAYHRLALVCERLGEGEESEELLLKAAQLAPENAAICCDLGYWNALRNRHEQARRYYEQALRQDPQLERAHNNLGLLLASLGETDAAMMHFNSAGLTVAEARSNLGFANMRQHRWQQAEMELRMALRAQPTLQQARALASTLDKLHRHEEIAISQQPQSSQPEGRAYIGLAKTAAGQLALQDIAESELRVPLQESPQISGLVARNELKNPAGETAFDTSLQPIEESEAATQASVSKSQPIQLETPQEQFAGIRDVAPALEETRNAEAQPADAFQALTQQPVPMNHHEAQVQLDRGMFATSEDAPQSQDWNTAPQTPPTGFEVHLASSVESSAAPIQLPTVSEPESGRPSSNRQSSKKSVGTELIIIEQREPRAEVMILETGKSTNSIDTPPQDRQFNKLEFVKALKRGLAR